VRLEDPKSAALLRHGSSSRAMHGVRVTFNTPQRSPGSPTATPIGLPQPKAGLAVMFLRSASSQVRQHRGRHPQLTLIIDQWVELISRANRVTEISRGDDQAIALAKYPNVQRQVVGCVGNSLEPYPFGHDSLREALVRCYGPQAAIGVPTSRIARSSKLSPRVRHSPKS